MPTKFVYAAAICVGKGLAFGGSELRPEATGYGIVYFLQELLCEANDELKGACLWKAVHDSIFWMCYECICAPPCLASHTHPTHNSLVFSA